MRWRREFTKQSRRRIVEPGGGLGEAGWEVLYLVAR